MIQIERTLGGDGVKDILYLYRVVGHGQNMKLWCEFENILTDDLFSRIYCCRSRKRLACDSGIDNLNIAESPWKDDNARILWKVISRHQQVLCCRSVRGKKYWMKSQRTAWCRRELGRHVDIFVYSSSTELTESGKAGDILITASQSRKARWEACGGLCWLYQGHILTEQVACSIIDALYQSSSNAPPVPVSIATLPKETSGPTRRVLDYGDLSRHTLVVACQNIVYLVVGVQFMRPLGCHREADYEDIQCAITALSRCRYCLVKWALLYAHLEVGLPLGLGHDEEGAEAGTGCVLCDLQGVLATELLFENAIGPEQVDTCHGSAPCLCSTCNKQYDLPGGGWDKGILMRLAPMRALHLLALDYCVGYRPSYVLTRPGVCTDRLRKLSLPCAIKDELESVFLNYHHLCCYDAATSWRERVTTTITEARREHKEMLRCQWDAMVAGEEGVEDPLYSSNDILTDALAEEVVTGWRCLEWFEDPIPTPQPTLSGLSVSWVDYSSLTREFCESKMYHFLPLWQVVCGLLELLAFWEHRAAWKKRRFSDDRWKADIVSCIGILQFLLNFPARSKDLSCCTVEHIDCMLTSVRGRCWVRLLACLRRVGTSQAEMDSAVRGALDACGQLGGCGGVAAADIEEIEQFAAGFRAVIYKSTKARSGGRRKQFVTATSGHDADLTPPKRYAEPMSHSQRIFRGRLLRPLKADLSADCNDQHRHQRKRRRLIYARTTSVTDEKSDIMYADRNALINADTAVFLNDRNAGMIVEKFALCRYLSLMKGGGNTPYVRDGDYPGRDVSLTLYNTLDDVISATACCAGDMGDMRLADFLEVSRGPGAWVHGRVWVDTSRSGCAGLSFQKNSKVEWLVSYSEGSIWLTLMVLVLWEAIYDPSLPLSMIREFLNRPIDLLPERGYHNVGGSPIRSDGFYIRRRQKIKSILHAIRCASPHELFDILQTSLALHSGSTTFAVHWDRVDHELLLSAGCALGGHRLAMVVEEMIRDPVCYCRGMPDLIFCVHYRDSLNPQRSSLVDVNTGGRSGGGVYPWLYDRICVSEVKSTHDKLSPWQKAWIRLFDKAGIPFEECRVN